MRRCAALSLSALLLLAACGGSDTQSDAGHEAASPSMSQPAVGSLADELLAEHGLDGMTADEIIEELDRTGDKPADLFASVRYDELLVSDPSEPEQEAVLPIEGDRFYLSVAPYVDGTHDCFYHSLTTCQGELVEKKVDVTITDSDGEVLVDDTVTTYPNGFVGFWLPRDIEGTLELSHDGRSATAPIATGSEDPTCLTTVRLT